MKKNKKQEDLRIPWLINTVGVLISKFIMRVTRKVKYDNSALENHNDGALILYNHFSNNDHFILGASYKFKRVNYVITSHFFYNKKLHGLLVKSNSISKDQFKPDLQAIRKMKKVIEQKGYVAIAPAGQVSIDGKSPFISPAITKLIKLCKCDVVALRIEGAHLAFPKWRKNKRKYPINAKYHTIIKKEDIPNFTDEELYSKIMEVLDVNDYELQHDRMYKIKGKGLAEGMESIFYVCPNCKQWHTHKTVDNKIECTNCKTVTSMDQYGFLHSENENMKFIKSEIDWYEYQKTVMKEMILSDNFKLEENMSLYRDNNESHELRYISECKLTLTTSEFYYTYPINGEVIRKDFNLEQMTQLPFSPHSHFEVPDEEGLFQFIPNVNQGHIVKWVQAIDVIRELK